MTGFTWDDTNTKAAAALHAEKLSAEEAASELMRRFGGFLTRCAVLGKWNRLGLGGKKGGRRPSRGRSRPKLSRRNSFSPRAAVPTLEGDLTSKPLRDLPPDDIPIEQRKQLLELGDNDCRWPYDDVGRPDFFFCGSPDADVKRGLPYCPFHMAVASNGKPASYPRIHWRGRSAA